MKSVFLIKILSILFVISTLSFSLLDRSAVAWGDPKIIQTLFGQDITIPEMPISDLLVVRVYFANRQQVAELITRYEPWEVNNTENYLVFGIGIADYNQLIAQGFLVEIEHELTALINRPMEPLPGQIDGIPGYPCYRTLEETYTTAAEITANYPALAEWIDIGDSWEKNMEDGLPGYDLMVLKLTNSKISEDKPKLFIMSALHASEFTTGELNTRFAEYLVTNYDLDPDITWLLDYVEFHLLLQANPDGRKHAENGEFWRKNTNENYCSPTPEKRGADLNRNFEFQWNCCGGSSSFECDQTYRGFYAASEPEVNAIQNYVRSIFPDQREDNLTSPAPQDATGIFIDIHAYGELVIWPWGFTIPEPPNGQALQTLGRKLAYFNNYEPSQAIELYPTDGTTIDFAYGDLGVAAYGFELGTTFYQSCSTFENTILTGNLPALIYAAKAARLPYLTPGGPDTLDVSVLPIAPNPIDHWTLNATIDDTRYSMTNGAEVSKVQAAEYYIDIPPWKADAVANQMDASDGIFNSPSEEMTATVDLSSLAIGTHTIFVRGQDADGNWGAINSVFVTIDPTYVIFLPLIGKDY